MRPNALTLLVLCSLWVLGFSAPALLADGASSGDLIVTVGSELKVAEPTSIAAIKSQPHEFAGQRVQVAGQVEGVCQRRGCWLDIADADGLSLRVKVEDGVLVFPAESVGGEAVVEGEVEIQEMERPAYIAWQRHLAEDAGQKFDDSEVGEGPFEMVRIRGRGARLTVATAPVAMGSDG